MQGVGIHDKHIEVIVKQMLRKLRIEDPGDSSFLMDEQVDRLVFKKEKESLEKEGKVPPRARPQLLGITKAALSTESWISAASFQETTRILIDAAVNAKVDYLKGLKENVIIGHLISAGTGLNALKKYKTVARKKIARSRSKAEEQVEAALEEKEAEQE